MVVFGSVLMLLFLSVLDNCMSVSNISKAFGRKSWKLNKKFQLICCNLEYLHNYHPNLMAKDSVKIQMSPFHLERNTNVNSNWVRKIDPFGITFLHCFPGYFHKFQHL